MNPVTILIGAGALAYGLYTLHLRKKAPEKFSKLAAMKKAYGEKAGTAIHVISYTVVPIALGIVFIVSGVLGKSPF